MRTFRSISTTRDVDATGFVKALASRLRLMKTMRSWFSSPSWPFLFECEEGIFEGEMHEGTCAFRISRGDGSESAVWKDGCVVCEAYDMARRRQDSRPWPARLRPVLLDALVEAGVIPGFEKPWYRKSAEPLEIDRYDCIDWSDTLMAAGDITMPVIYVSYLASRNGWAVDPVRLEQVARGQARVVYEKDEAVSWAMKDEVGKGNPYNGVVKIVTGKGMGRFVSPVSYSDGDSFLDAIMTQLHVQTCSDRRWASWNFPATRRNRILAENETLRRKARELEDTIDELKTMIGRTDPEIDDIFDRLNQSLDEERGARMDAEAEVERWKALALSRNDGGRIGLECSERPFYDGEITDCLLSALASWLESRGDEGGGEQRMETVIRSLLSSNSRDGTGDGMADGIRGILERCRNIGDREMSALARCGLKCSSDGKHVKVSLFGDSRYVTVLARTTSDVRSARNAAAVIRKAFFPH